MRVTIGQPVIRAKTQPVHAGYRQTRISCLLSDEEWNPRGMFGFMLNEHLSMQTARSIGGWGGTLHLGEMMLRCDDMTLKCHLPPHSVSWEQGWRVKRKVTIDLRPPVLIFRVAGWDRYIGESEREAACLRFFVRR